MDTLNHVLSEQLAFLRDNPILVGLTIVGIVIAVGLILILITRSSRFSERRIILLLTLAFGLLMANYFFPGDMVRGDGPLHTARAWLMMDVLAKGETPIWSNRWYFGFPQEMFYGPLPYLALGETAKLLNVDIYVGTKIGLWVLQVASGVFMYLYARTRFTQRPLAILAALAYMISWEHFGVVRRFGILPLAFIYLLLPLFFLLLEHYLKKNIGLIFASIIGGILCALAVMSHIQYGIYLCGTYFAVIAWIAFVNLIYRDTRGAAQVALLFIGTGLAAALFGGWYLVPSLLERVYLPSLPLEIDAPTLAGLWLVIRNLVLITRLFNAWGQGYIGLTILLPAFGAVIAAAIRLLRRSNLTREVVVAGYPFLIVGLGFFLLDPLKRYTGVWLFFVCIAAAYGYLWLANWLAERISPVRFYQTVTLLMILELGPALLLVGDFLKVDDVHEEVARLQTNIDAQGVPGRIMVFKPDRGIFWRPADAIDTGASVVYGSPLKVATNAINFMSAISVQLAVEVYDHQQQPSETLLTLLRLMNIRYIIFDKDNYMEVPNTSPVLFAPALQVNDLHDPNGEMGTDVRPLYEERAILPDYVDAVATRMGVDAQNATADYFLVDDLPANTPVAANNCGDNQTFSFEKTVEQDTSFRFNYTTCEDGYIRLAYAYYPLFKLEVDGVEIPYFKDAMHMIVFVAPAGTHSVQLRADATPLRKVWFVAAVLGMAALLIYVIFYPLVKRLQYRSKSSQRLHDSKLKNSV